MAATDTSAGSFATWELANVTLVDGLNQVRIRVTDGEGNVFTASANTLTGDGTDGAQDLTYLFLSLDPISDLTLGTIIQDQTVSDQSTVTVRTNSQTGYQVLVRKQNADPAGTLQSGTDDFPDLSAWSSTANAGNGNAQSWPSLTPGNLGLGFRLRQVGTDPDAYNA